METTSLDRTIWMTRIPDRFVNTGKSVTAKIQHTGYNLTKIIDAHGEKIEPFYAQYQTFMMGKPLIVWAGLQNSSRREDNGTQNGSTAGNSTAGSGTGSADKPMRGLETS